MKLKRILGTCLAFSAMLATASCGDLGEAASNDKGYCELFNVYCINESVEEYKMSAFYNDEAFEHYKCAMDYSKYRYFAVSPTKNLTIEDFYFVVYAEEATEIEYKVYLTHELPDKFANVRTSYENLIKYKDGTDSSYSIVESNEPVGEPLFTNKVSLPENRGKDISVRYKTKTLEITTSDYIVVQFTNNSDAGFTFDGTENLDDVKTIVDEREAHRVNLKFTCLLIECD